MVIDFHTHAFPDEIAEKAIKTLEDGCNEKAFHSGTVSALLSSMDNAGINTAVLANIATKPSQFEPILKWSKLISTKRVIPFASIHPDDANIKEKVKIIFKEGIKGIKLHPYYQNFNLDSVKAFPIYEEAEKLGIIVMAHNGFDIAFERKRITDPDKIIAVKERFPELKLVATHFGSWEDWDEVEKKLIGKKIFLEISFSLEVMQKNQAERMLNAHPSDYLLFGTDSPWTDQKNALELLNKMNLDDKKMDAILFKNAKKLLNL